MLVSNSILRLCSNFACVQKFKKKQQLEQSQNNFYVAEKIFGIYLGKVFFASPEMAARERKYHVLENSRF
jgi:hypothetical protein